MRHILGKSLVCPAEVWILLNPEKLKEVGRHSYQIQELQKKLCIGSFGNLGGLACHPDSFAGATEPAPPGHLGRVTTATSALYKQECTSTQ